MVSLISTGSNYIIVIMGVIYAITCFTVFLPSTEKRQVKRMDRQELFMFVFHFICYGVLFAKTLDTKIIFLYLAQVVFFKMLIFVYSRVYVDCSRILMNHTCFLLLIGFVMLTRLSFDKAVKQFIIAAATSLIVLFIPYFMEKAVWLKKLKWIYGLLGLIFLSSVFVIGTSQNGATNWISLGHGIALQPSEFVKISFVFFIAAMLTKAPNFKTMLLTSIFAACYHINWRKGFRWSINLFCCICFSLLCRYWKGNLFIWRNWSGHSCGKVSVHAVCACAGSFYCLERSLVCH